MKQIITSLGLLSVASCARLHGYIDLGSNANTMPITQKPIFGSISAPQGSIKMAPQVQPIYTQTMPVQPIYTSTMPVPQAVQPIYTSTMPVPQAVQPIYTSTMPVPQAVQPIYTSTIPVQQPMPVQPIINQTPDFSYIQAPSIPTFPTVQPMIQAPAIQPTLIQAPMPSQYYNPLAGLSIPQIPSLDYAQHLYSQSGVQNLNNNLASTNNQNVVVNTSASGNSNANTSLNNNAYSTGSSHIIVPTTGTIA